jgi:hypothetical protein
MKRIIILLFSITLFSITSYGQAYEAEQLLLNWEKLQTLEQMLDNMYTGYRIIDQGYTKIKNIAEGNYSLHQLFIDGLLAVNPSVRNYKRIPFIIQYQQALIQEYKRAYERFSNDPHFSPEEIQYLYNVYAFLFKASVKNLDDLIMIITATKMRMSDEERMQSIDRIFFDMENKLRFLRTFNSSTQMLAIQRARETNDLQSVRSLYGLY